MTNEIVRIPVRNETPVDPLVAGTAIEASTSPVPPNDDATLGPATKPAVPPNDDDDGDYQSPMESDALAAQGRELFGADKLMSECNAGRAKISRGRAIRLKCIDCSGGNRHEVEKCRCNLCTLWPFRMGENPFRTKRVKVMTDEQKLAASARMKKMLEANALRRQQAETA